MRHHVFALLALALPGLASAQGYQDKWEWSLAAIYQDSETATSPAGSELTLDSELGIGFGLQYRFNNRMMLGTDLEWLRPGYSATAVNDQGETVRINHEFSQFNGRIKGTFNLLEGPFTPYIEAGFGWSWFDSNVASGPPLVGCWWVWPWGYVCSGYYNTYSKTASSYGGALGFRYQFRGGMVGKLSYNTYETDFGGATAIDPTLSAVRLEFAWGF